MNHLLKVRTSAGGNGIVRIRLLDHVNHIFPLIGLVNNEWHAFVERLIVRNAHQNTVTVAASSGLEDFLPEVRLHTELLCALLHEPANNSKLPIVG
jgi:hypothetical protein